MWRYRALLGSGTVVVTDGAGFAANDLVRVTLSGEVSYHWATAVAAVVPKLLTLHDCAGADHTRPDRRSSSAPRWSTWRRLDAGVWGNRLRISVIDDDPRPGRPDARCAAIHRDHRSGWPPGRGVQPGTVLEFSEPAHRGRPRRIR